MRLALVIGEDAGLEQGQQFVEVPSLLGRRAREQGGQLVRRKRDADRLVAEAGQVRRDQIGHLAPEPLHGGLVKFEGGGRRHRDNLTRAGNRVSAVRLTLGTDPATLHPCWKPT